MIQLKIKQKSFNSIFDHLVCFLKLTPSMRDSIKYLYTLKSNFMSKVNEVVKE